MPIVAQSDYPNPTAGERAAAKDVICQIVAAASGTLKYATRLHKAFYLAHLYFYEDEGYFLTAYPIVKMPNGPGIHQCKDLLSELENEGRIEITENRFGERTEYTYRSGEKRPAEDSRGKDSIKRAVEKVNSMMPKELSKWTHDFSRSWNEADPGHQLNFSVDLLEDEDYKDLMEGASLARQQVLEIMGAAANHK